MTELHGKVAVITGASLGIGAETARVFSKAGAHVVLLARSAQIIKEIAAELPGPALAIGCDVADYSQVSMAVSAAMDRFGGVDILVNNAGTIHPISRLAESDPAQWGQAVDVNLIGAYHAVRALLPGMLQAGGGTILTLSSGAAHGPVEGWSHYCTSKAGVAMLTRTIDHEERPNNIRAIGLSPGTVATGMQKDIKDSGVNPVSKIPWENHIAPNWPARALLWMCSDDANEYLGEEISLKDDAVRRRIGLIS